jgi:hypothetical protein
MSCRQLFGSELNSVDMNFQGDENGTFTLLSSNGEIFFHTLLHKCTLFMTKLTKDTPISAEEVESLAKEELEMQELRNKAGASNFASLVFDKVFCRDVKTLLTMEEMWKTRRPPNPLNLAELYAEKRNPSKLELPFDYVHRALSTKETVQLFFAR